MNAPVLGRNMANIRNEIVFVCTANTCRSPMAEGLFRHALAAQEDPLNQLKVSSAGVSVFDRQKANPNSVTAMSKVGIDLSNHQSRPLTQELIDSALAYFAMTETHLAMLTFQLSPPPENAFLMRSFIGDESDTEIPDPFGMSLVHYESCRDSMVEAIPSLIKAVERLYKAQFSQNSDDK